jgi:hypothetical protein
VFYLSPAHIFAPLAAHDQSVSASPPISIGVIFDLSASTNSFEPSFAVKPKELTGLFTRLFQLNGQNQYFIISMSTTPEVILARSKEEKATLKALSKLSKIKHEGATALFDACYLGIERVAQGD